MLNRFCLLCALLVFAAPSAFAQEADVMRAGPLDNGKMWLFENPPVEYLADTYDFRPDAAWFERARLAALRLPGCSASFVSSDGLIATNHHCVRGSIVDVSQPDERLADEGFFARSMEEERAVPGLYVDQLVAITDVTNRIEAAVAEAETDAERAEARRAEVEAVEAEMAAGEEGMTVQVVSLYNGGKYSAYTFRRYDDLRLVAAPETALGFFGGDADNFTYPRYALDFAFLRAYDDAGRPLDTSAFYFPWSTEGTEPGDLIFVIGNPGSTDRGDTFAQLEWRRDVQIPSLLEYLGGRIDALDVYLAANPDDAAVRNQRFGLSNAFKAYTGRQDALANEIITSRRRDSERQFRAAIDADPALRAEYGDLFGRMTDLQRAKRELAPAYGAFAGITNARYGSAPLLRGYLVAQLLGAQQAGADDAAAGLRGTIASIEDKPSDIDERYLAAQLRQFERFLEPALVNPVLRGRTPAEAAADIVAESALATAEGTQQALAAGTLGPDDPAVALALAVASRYADYQSASAALDEQEGEVARRLGQARFAVYGTAVPPDATFSPRFTDGVVRPYEYNGTVAPPYTTLFGLYDRNASFGQDSEWALPDTWLPAPPDLDRSTPLNFVSTSDTIGGNSGSPAVDRDLRLVGLNFDRTIEGLSRDYIYFADRGRNVMVDARAVIESLDTVYDLDRIVQELRTGEAVATEAEADARP
ncbi:MAG: S46 family peptidase [Rhodothermales bacterium]